VASAFRFYQIKPHRPTEEKHAAHGTEARHAAHWHTGGPPVPLLKRPRRSRAALLFEVRRSMLDVRRSHFLGCLAGPVLQSMNLLGNEMRRESETRRPRRPRRGAQRLIGLENDLEWPPCWEAKNSSFRSASFSAPSAASAFRFYQIKPHQPTEEKHAAHGTEARHAEHWHTGGPARLSSPNAPVPLLKRPR